MDNSIQRGRQTGQKIWGKAKFQKTEKYLGNLDPYLRDMALLSWSNFARPVLDLKTRSLCMVAALAITGRAELRTHTFGALNNGATPEEIREVIRQMLPYAGLANAIDAFAIANKAIAEHQPISDRPKTS
ncbi:MAG: carboxymuconolactone decarboxylase family protein [Chloroflexota bacterium]